MNSLNSFDGYEGGECDALEFRYRENVQLRVFHDKRNSTVALIREVETAVNSNDFATEYRSSRKIVPCRVPSVDLLFPLISKCWESEEYLCISRQAPQQLDWLYNGTHYHGIADDCTDITE